MEELNLECCPVCFGRGVIESSVCHQCLGQGHVGDDKPINNSYEGYSEEFEDNN